MNKFFLKLLVTSVFCYSSIYVKGIPSGPYTDSVYNTNIKTVQFFMEGWEFSYPILKLNENSHLIFSFDDLDIQGKTYNYTIIQCNADWIASRESFNEYMDGFPENQITDYQSSLSTNISYTHYSLSIPNDNVNLKISGNYALIVYADKDEDHPILIKRFVVSEERVKIQALERRPILPKYQNTHQQIDFSIFNPDYNIDDPQGTVKIIIVKNNQWKYSITDLIPLYIKDRELIYTYDDKTLFNGSNEFRSFDIKALKYQSANIASIKFVDSSYHVEIHTDIPRLKQGYFYNEDFNGKYFIENKEGSQSALDAEYVHVQFNFQADPFIDGDIFLYGAFTNYNCSDLNKMHYNTDKNLFEKDILVKQGLYNYIYAFRPNGTSDIDDTYFENSFYETENDYIIYVYHRAFDSRYDKLIGVKIINSLKKTN